MRNKKPQTTAYAEERRPRCEGAIRLSGLDQELSVSRRNGQMDRQAGEKARVSADLPVLYSIYGLLVRRGYLRDSRRDSELHRGRRRAVSFVVLYPVLVRRRVLNLYPFCSASDALEIDKVRRDRYARA